MLALTQAVSDRAGAPISVFRSPAASSFRKHPSCPAAINIHPMGNLAVPWQLCLRKVRVTILAPSWLRLDELQRVSLPHFLPERFLSGLPFLFVYFCPLHQCYR